MNKLLGFVGMTVGGWIGWKLGEPFSMFLAFLLSMVGTGLGLYWGHRIGRDYF
jgi:uncharacterized membrane protein YeaQ/YmgE (transglycosylase-associated protein family)